MSGPSIHDLVRARGLLAEALRILEDAKGVSSWRERTKRFLHDTGERKALDREGGERR